MTADKKDKTMLTGFAVRKVKINSNFPTCVILGEDPDQDRDGHQQFKMESRILIGIKTMSDHNTASDYGSGSLLFIQWLTE